MLITRQGSRNQSMKQEQMSQLFENVDIKLVPEEPAESRNGHKASNKGISDLDQ